MMRNAAVLSRAPMVMQSMNHLIIVFFQSSSVEVSTSCSSSTKLICSWNSHRGSADFVSSMGLRLGKKCSRAHCQRKLGGVVNSVKIKKRMKTGAEMANGACEVMGQQLSNKVDHTLTDISLVLFEQLGNDIGSRGNRGRLERRADNRREHNGRLNGELNGELDRVN